MNCPCCALVKHYRNLGAIPLGEQVRQARINLGLSQHAVEERLHVNRGYLSRLEKGRFTPSLRMFQRLATVLQEVLVVGPIHRTEERE